MLVSHFLYRLQKMSPGESKSKIQKTAENLCSQANPVPKHNVWEPY